MPLRHLPCDLLISAIKYAEMKKQEAEFHKSGAVADKTVLTLQMRILWV